LQNKKTHDEKILKIRNSLSLLLGSSVQKIFPNVKLGFIGPATEDGFYYDFLSDKGLSSFQFEEIEGSMKEIILEKIKIENSVLPIMDAKKIFYERGEILKVELVEDLISAGKSEVSIYTAGDFIDLCEGPHVENTKRIPIDAFKLDRVSGAYWKGSEKNQMLSRIYGLAFSNKKDLKFYIKQREEAEKRDHRKVGAELDLFVNSQEVGKGLPLLTEKGATIYRIMERFIVDEEIYRGYSHVKTPALGRKFLYEISGHWEHYKDSMYPPINVDGEDYILRPMTCPHHFMLYKSKPRSYKELPIKYAEISPMYRKERSGELSGLIRIMGFHLADAHIFIEPEKLKTVFKEVVDLIVYVMKSLGLAERCWYRASLRDDDKEKYIDNQEGWIFTEKILLEICEELGLEYTIGKGHAAFYGPKLDVQMLTVGGREETLFTNQIDLALSERFNLEYTDRDGSTKRPWIVHRSSVGALERTIAFIIEHYGGAFPIWLSPIQVSILTITERSFDFSSDLQRRLHEIGIRAELDGRNENLNKKVREARLKKVPYICVIGDQEVKNNTLMVTNRDTGRKEKISTEIFIDRLLRENSSRAINLGCVGID